MLELTLCSSNVGKIAEFSRMIGREIVSTKLRVPEIQSLDPSEVCSRKAEDAFKQLDRPVLVDDSGLHLAALNGFPGALVAEVLDAGGVELVSRMIPMGGSTVATATTAIGYADRTGVYVFLGSLEGSIAAVPRGSSGFGYDSIFVPAGSNRTLAEMDPAEKDAISPRSSALTKLREFLAMHDSNES